MYRLIFFMTWVILLNQIAASAMNAKAAVATDFIILHNNDMHARFEETSVSGGKCSTYEAETDKCYGGFARVAHVIRKHRQEAKEGGPPVIYLNAGDTYTGTPWFTVFKGNISAAFLNKLQPNATSLGNHEFDENIAGLVPFLNAAEFPVLGCNLDLTKTPEIAQTNKLAKSTVLVIQGVKVGVIGYLTPDTKFLTTPNEVEYKPEIEAINAEATVMKNNGINIIIALGHSGYQKDQEIALKCPDVDVVVGGHSHSFLYTGSQPDAEKSEGPYPTIVKQANGKRVPVVQAYCFTKYMGKLHVQFDKDGNLLEFDGIPILLNASIPREDDILQLLEVYRPSIIDLETTTVGRTKVHLEGRGAICRREECNLGNLLTDSMVYGRVLDNQNDQYWTDAAIAFLQGGGIRSSIEKRPDWSITQSDILTLLPFKNNIFMAQISGRTLKNALEHSATIRNRDTNGGFLQMSGVRATYDYNRDVGQRVTSVEVKCSACNVPKYEALVESNLYHVLIADFLLNGGDGHVFREPNTMEPVRLQKNDQGLLMQYLQQREFVYPEVDGRINIVENSKGASTGSSMAQAASVSSCILITIVSLVLYLF